MSKDKKISRREMLSYSTMAVVGTTFALKSANLAHAQDPQAVDNAEQETSDQVGERRLRTPRKPAAVKKVSSTRPTLILVLFH